VASVIHTNKLQSIDTLAHPTLFRLTIHIGVKPRFELFLTIARLLLPGEGIQRTNLTGRVSREPQYEQ
jgi:hypothetical protein